MDRTTVVLITLVIYNVVLVSIGLVTRRRTRDGTDFFLGGRGLGPWVAAISASASSSSAWSLLGVSGGAWLWGLGALWMFPACVGGFVINWTLVAPALHRHSHRSDDVTVTDVLAGPAGAPLRRTIAWTCSLIVIVCFGAYVGSQFMAAGKAFHANFGMDSTLSVLVGAGIVVLYTLLGGFWAVSVTDTLQGVMMALASILLPVAALVAVGGPSGLADGLAAVGVAGYDDLFRNLPPAAAAGFVLGLLGIGFGYPGQPHVVNRFMALRNDAAAVRTARVVSITWAVIIYAGMLLLGLCGRVLVDVDDKEKIFFTAANELFDPVTSGILMAAVLSALMSTADSQLLVAASAVTRDMGLGGSTRESMLRRSRIVVVLLCAAALLPALFWGEDIFNTVLFAWSAIGCAFGPVLMVTLLRGRVAPGRTLLCVVSGFTLSVVAFELRGQGVLDPWLGPPLERIGAFLVPLGILLLPGGRAEERA